MFYLGFFSVTFGYFFSVIAFILSFWIATVILIIPYITKKLDRQTKIPFIPFLFMGSILSISIGFIYKIFYLI